MRTTNPEHAAHRRPGTTTRTRRPVRQCGAPAVPFYWLRNTCPRCFATHSTFARRGNPNVRAASIWMTYSLTTDELGDMGGCLPAEGSGVASPPSNNSRPTPSSSNAHSNVYKISTSRCTYPVISCQLTATCHLQPWQHQSPSPSSIGPTATLGRPPWATGTTA